MSEENDTDKIKIDATLKETMLINLNIKAIDTNATPISANEEKQEVKDEEEEEDEEDEDEEIIKVIQQEEVEGEKEEEEEEEEQEEEEQEEDVEEEEHVKEEEEEKEKEEETEFEVKAEKEVEKKVEKKSEITETENEKQETEDEKQEKKSKKFPSMQQLLNLDRDLEIPELKLLTHYTLQLIAEDWLEENIEFFDYEDEPYLFYLENLVSRKFRQDDVQTLYCGNENDSSTLVNLIRTGIKKKGIFLRGVSRTLTKFFQKPSYETKTAVLNGFDIELKKNHLDVYSPFRLLATYAAKEYRLKHLNSPVSLPRLKSEVFDEIESKFKLVELLCMTFPEQAITSDGAILENPPTINRLLAQTTNINLSSKFSKPEDLQRSSQKMLGHRFAKTNYNNDENWNTPVAKSLRRAPFPAMRRQKNMNYLNFYNYNNSYNEFKPNAEKPNGENDRDRAEMEEESKKVFMIINSFGGSVGNGVTVHDALQFIKAGSLTLGLGVAASAASLALGGGTIGERYITEGCHVMVHQPEGEIKGQASDVWVDSQEILRLRATIAEIYSLSTYRPQHKMLHDLDRDFYLDAKGTVEYGLADEIATNDAIHEIIQMTGRAWEYDNKRQERLLEIRDENQMNYPTQTQN
jgi:ATP-dependent Clp protease protease subunit